MVDGVLGEVELASLPLGGAEHGAAYGVQSGTVIPQGQSTLILDPCNITGLIRLRQPVPDG
jgi:hypothetical protein